jgi:hypothetical protein
MAAANACAQINGRKAVVLFGTMVVPMGGLTRIVISI